MSRLNFKLEKVATGSRARATTFHTLHNKVETPIFMPVGTRATVRAQTLETLQDSGSQILLANTYHLLNRPGPEVFRRMGGIHRFMNWNKSVLTDSGGFQIFSLPHSRKMTEIGAEFQSYVDGTKILLTPELSIEMQKAIGSDIMMVLDQCVPSTSERALCESAMELTHRWAVRSLEARKESPQSMFGIVQGACFPDLRKRSAEFLTSLPFDGFAIGGLAVGESKAEREDIAELSAELLPADRPRYLMGVGMPIDLLEAVHRGVDMFDCIIPTALAKQGVAFTRNGELKLRRSVYRFVDAPIDPLCGCPTCTRYSKSYLHHLIKCEEVLGWHLIGCHNLYFYHGLMREMRKRILEDKFVPFYNEMREKLLQEDAEFPAEVARKKRRKTIPLVRGDYEVHVSPQGHSSIKHRSSGEIMHSVSDPVEEAVRVYVNQSRIERRLESPGLEELVIWDVGLGAATNAMATIRRIEESIPPSQAGKMRAVRIVSFENDLDSLKLALLHPGRFPHLRHGGPAGIVQEGQWVSKSHRLEWNLLEGDFRIRMVDAPAPDLIFYDPFSYKTDSPLWTLKCFKELFEKCKGRSVELFTYSASTAVRSALLAAGFYVGRGVGTGPKAETTIACTPEALQEAEGQGLTELILGAPWLERWERSGSRFPHGLPDGERDEIENRIRSHPQFGL